MSSSFPLPLECPQIIIRHVARQPNCGALASLLGVSKFVRSATLPMMYENPFPRILIRKDSMRSYRNSHADLLRLVQVLLRSLPTAGNITDLLRAAYITDTMNPRYQAPLPELMSTPYYSFVTTVDFERFFLSNCCIFNKNTLAACESFDDYLDRCGLITWYLQQNIIGLESTWTDKTLLLSQSPEIFAGI
ncbi:hypothetical protein BGX24_010921 [Mortierella sp. AD032]|nr:hypothetical protein BGX24_010921 [Mortierella sp. AD032]